MRGKRLFCLLLAAVGVLSAAGCKKGLGEGGDELSTAKEEAWTETATAVAATLGYEGSYSVAATEKVTSSYAAGGLSSSKEYESTLFTTLNGDTRELYLHVQLDEGEYRSTLEGKSVKVGELFHAYQKGSEYDNGEFDEEAIGEKCTPLYYEQWLVFTLEEICEDVVTFSGAPSARAYEEAFGSVYGGDGNRTVSVMAEKTEGSTSLTVQSAGTLSLQEQGKIRSSKIEKKKTYEVVEGKLQAYGVALTETVCEGSDVYVTSYEMHYDFSYGFDAERYGQCTLDTTVSLTSEEISGSKKESVNVEAICGGGRRSSSFALSGATVEEQLASLKTAVQDSSYLACYAISPYATYYIDEAMRIPVSSDISETDWARVQTLYVRATPRADYVYYDEKQTIVYDEKFDWIFEEATRIGYPYFREHSDYQRISGSTYSFAFAEDSSPVKDGYGNVYNYVNGELIKGTSYTMDAGEYYSVERKISVQNPAYFCIELIDGNFFDEGILGFIF